MNKHPYKRDGQQVIGGPLVGWVFSDANAQVKCPRCGSDPGFCCQTPGGRKTDTPHGERVAALRAKFPDSSAWTRTIGTAVP